MLSPPEPTTAGELVATCCVASLVLVSVLDPASASLCYEALESFALGWKWLRFSVLDFCGAAVACDGYRRATHSRPQPWIETLAVSLFSHFGGTTLVGFFLGQPPSWLVSHNAARSLLLAWYLTFCVPAWHRAFPSVAAVFAVGAALGSGHAVTSWGADKALRATHEAAREGTFAAVVCGCLGACGGSLFCAAYFGEEFKIKWQNARRKALLGSIAYYLLLDPHDILPLRLGKNAKLAVGLYYLVACANSLGLTAVDPVALLERALCAPCRIAPALPPAQRHVDFADEPIPLKRNTVVFLEVTSPTSSISSRHTTPFDDDESSVDPDKSTIITSSRLRLENDEKEEELS